MTDERKDILSKNIEELQSDLKCGKLKPIEVLQAYQAKVKFFSSYVIQGESKNARSGKVERLLTSVFLLTLYIIIFHDLR